MLAKNYFHNASQCAGSLTSDRATPPFTTILLAHICAERTNSYLSSMRVESEQYPRQVELYYFRVDRHNVNDTTCQILRFVEKSETFF